MAVWAFCSKVRGRTQLVGVHFRLGENWPRKVVWDSQGVESLGNASECLRESMLRWE